MVLQNSSTLKNQKPMILMEFIRNTVTMCFPIPKREKVEKVKKVILTFSHPFDHCALLGVPLSAFWTSKYHSAKQKISKNKSAFFYREYLLTRSKESLFCCCVFSLFCSQNKNFTHSY